MFVARAANPVFAIALMPGADMFIAGTTLLTKTLETDTPGAPLHPLQISHGRFVFAFLAIGAFATALRLGIEAICINRLTGRDAPCAD